MSEQHDYPPQKIRLHRNAGLLEVAWEDGARLELPCEYLRVFSPSAELRGHGLAEPMLIGGKRNVHIVRIDLVGRYAAKLEFDDGHNTGIYSWSFLNELARDYEKNWARYLERLAEHDMSRDDDVVKLSAVVKQYVPPKNEP